MVKLPSQKALGTVPSSKERSSDPGGPRACETHHRRAFPMGVTGLSPDFRFVTSSSRAEAWKGAFAARNLNFLGFRQHQSHFDPIAQEHSQSGACSGHYMRGSRTSFACWAIGVVVAEIGLIYGEKAMKPHPACSLFSRPAPSPVWQHAPDVPRRVAPQIL